VIKNRNLVATSIVSCHFHDMNDTKVFFLYMARW